MRCRENRILSSDLLAATGFAAIVAYIGGKAFLSVHEDASGLHASSTLVIALGTHPV